MKYTCNEVIPELLDLAYGQRNSVALPGKKSTPSIKSGRFPAGVGDVLDHLLDEYTQWNSSTKPRHVDWTFLIGGPGNGKSQALNELAGALLIDIPSPQSGAPAPRTVPGDWPASTNECDSCAPLQIVFINDASVPRQELAAGSRGSLFHDICDGVTWLSGQSKDPLAIFGNVNRGILIEEINRLTKSNTPQEQVAETILQWLSSSRNTEGVGSIVVSTSHNQPHYAQLCISRDAFGGQLDIVVHAVFLDTMSLLEPCPDVPGNKTVNFTSSPPRTGTYEPIGELRPSSSSRRETVAGERVQATIDQSLWVQGGCKPIQCSAHDLCPFVQNATWLRDPDLREYFLSTLRGAEIAAGRRLTYRDLGGHISLAILGRLEQSWLQGQHPCKWVHELHQEITTSNGADRSISAIVRLAEHRIYANLFSTRDHGIWLSEYEFGANVERYPLHGALHTAAFPRPSAQRPQSWEKGFENIDPARDTGEWQISVIDRCDALHIESPVVKLLKQDSLPQAACSKVERLLDNRVKEELQKVLQESSFMATRRARALWHWRSVQLLRHIGLATGNIAFGHVLDSWLKLHRLSLYAPSHESRNDISKGLQSLVVQTGEVNGEPRLILAPLRPRTYALPKVPSNALIIAMPPTDIRVQPVAEGDSLLAEVKMLQQGQSYVTVTRFPVDLSLAREALLQSGQHASSKLPFTEIAVSTFARIERTRAALVGRCKTIGKDVYYLDGDGNPRIVQSFRQDRPFEIQDP
jgi:hypothetical protein